MGEYDLIRKIAKTSYTSKECDINQIKYDILYDFEGSPSFETVLITGTLRKVQITDESSIKVNPSKKRILSIPDEDFNIGEIVTWNGETWLITNVDSDKQVQTKGIIEKTNQILKFYKTTISLSQPTLFEVPCIMTTGSRNYIGSEENKFVSSPKSRFLAICPSGTINKNDMHLRFIMNGYPYKIAGIDNVTYEGLIFMELNDDVLNPNDNYDLGVADYYNNVSLEVNEEGNSELLL